MVRTSNRPWREPVMAVLAPVVAAVLTIGGLSVWTVFGRAGSPADVSAEGAGYSFRS